jgi:hypothetical protein
MWKVRGAIRKRFLYEYMAEEEAAPDLISYCLQQLYTCSAGTALYILDCLCPDDIDLVLDLVRLDLSCPHQHKRLSKKDSPLPSNSSEELLALLRARTSILPAKDFPHFWLELTRRWLLSCPVDPEYCRTDDAGTEMFCRKLRGELVERILNLR